MRTERVRLSLELAPEVDQQLRKIQFLSNADSKAEVVRRSLAVFDLLVRHCKLEQGSVILEYPDQRRERLLLL